MGLRISSLFVLLAGPLLVGCQQGSRLHEVSGQVTFDGDPVEMGEILFESPNPAIRTEAGRITKGSYKFNVSPGPYIVRINAIKAFPLPPGEKTVTGESVERRQFLPAKYNAESELKIDVKGATKQDFPLKSE